MKLHNYDKMHFQLVLIELSLTFLNIHLIFKTN